MPSKKRSRDFSKKVYAARREMNNGKVKIEEARKLLRILRPHELTVEIIISTEVIKAYRAYFKNVMCKEPTETDVKRIAGIAAANMRPALFRAFKVEK